MSLTRAKEPGIKQSIHFKKSVYDDVIRIAEKKGWLNDDGKPNFSGTVNWILEKKAAQAYYMIARIAQLEDELARAKNWLEADRE